MTTTIQDVNIYLDGNVWCYAAWTAEGHDHNDTLDAGTEQEARAEIAAMWPGARVALVQASA